MAADLVARDRSLPHIVYDLAATRVDRPNEHARFALQARHRALGEIAILVKLRAAPGERTALGA